MGMVQKTRSTFLNVGRWVILYVEIQNSWKSMSSRRFPSFHVKLVKLLVFGKAIGCPRCFSRWRLRWAQWKLPKETVEITHNVRSFVRPSESPRSYKDWGGFMGHMLLQNCTYTCSKNCHSGRIRAAVPHEIRKYFIANFSTLSSHRLDGRPCLRLGSVEKNLLPLIAWSPRACCCSPRILLIENFCCDTKLLAEYLPGPWFAFANNHCKSDSPIHPGHGIEPIFTVMSYPTNNQSKHCPL